MDQPSFFNHKKYRPHRPFSKPDRRWPGRSLNHAPDFCSVDLRDGNQALIEPMNGEQKLSMFQMLVDVGFKEIEVGFPAASQPDFAFIRRLIEEDLIPEDVTVQVLTPAREALIKRSFEALHGVRRAIVHLYNSTSSVQREQVFRMGKEEVRELAVSGARLIAECAAARPETEWRFQYSPESFTGTEMEYALSVCNAVIAQWRPTPERKVIINLPATVEVSMPNVYADQIEWMSERLTPRACVRLSLHTHNDRGCGVAAAELGILAGAERIEGTMLGNGERTGNMCVVTMAMNLYSQGIDPRLDLHDMERITRTVEECTQIAVHPRHPYAGELVYAAFSGSHQDAINKCLRVDQERRAQDPECPWEVAYLPIDPRDLGRSYQSVVRVNSQSGKGGMAFVLEQQFKLKLPRWMQLDLSPYVQAEAERVSREVSASEIMEVFERTYMRPFQTRQIDTYRLTRAAGQDFLHVNFEGSEASLRGTGCGVLSAFAQARSAEFGANISLTHYDEHTLGENESAEAIAYLELSWLCPETRLTKRSCGAARSRDIIVASLQAFENAISRVAPPRRPRARPTRAERVEA